MPTSVIELAKGLFWAAVAVLIANTAQVAWAVPSELPFWRQLLGIALLASAVLVFFKYVLRED